MPDGWRLWAEWQKVIAPHNQDEIDALHADRGMNLGYVRGIRGQIVLTKCSWLSIRIQSVLPITSDSRCFGLLVCDYELRGADL